MRTDPQTQTHPGLKYDKQINIATAGTRGAAKWKNQSIDISKFVDRLSRTTRTAETVTEFLRMPKSDQDNIKDVGAFVGGSLKGGRRKKTDIANRHILTLDMDYANPDAVDLIKEKLKGVCYTIYSTHKHQADKPRLRLIVYPDRPLMPDEYQATMRRIADKIDIETFDDTTFDVNRLMYWPSTPCDGEYVFYHNDAPFLPVNKVLDAYGPDSAWKDVSLWPTSSRETRDLERRLKKQENPFEKANVVGAFCRHVSIHDALDKHLSDVYRKENKDRYTYIDGTSSHGLVVYDDKFVYSNHGSDPACGQTCNAFDIIRIHKYGNMDNEAKEGTPTHRMPSYRAMSEFAKTIEPVKIELITSGLELDPAEFDEFDENAEWIAELQTGDNGQVKPTFFNAGLIVGNDPQTFKKMRKNMFSEKIENTETEENWNDLDSINVRTLIGKRYNVDFPEKKIEDGIIKQAENNAYHPVRQYLESLKWDGKERIDTVFIDYMGCEDNIYTREISRCWFSAAVHRVFEPGFKFDTAIVLGGAQGIGKTTFIRELALKKWYGELTSFEPKIAMEEITGKWIIEINEMGATNKQELEQQKSFLSACHTRVRMAYARHAFDFKRQCVFIGSTNQTEYLKDSTGNRRWWPIDCEFDKIDIEKLRSEVNQIWAEAYLLYIQSAPVYLSEEAEHIAKYNQELKRETDPWEGIINEWLETEAEIERYDSKINFGGGEKEIRDQVCVIEIWQDCLDQKDKPRPAEGKRIGVILDQNPLWKKGSTSRFGARFGTQKVWKKEIPF